MQELHRAAGALAARFAGTGTVAWFDQGRPALPAVLEEAAGAGHGAVLVVPYLLQWGFPAQFSLPAQVLAFARAHPEVAVRLAAPVGAPPAVEAALAERVAAALQGPPITDLDAEALARFAAHEEMPRRAPTRPTLVAPQAHLLLCQGRWCLDAGATELEGALREELRERGIERGRGRVQLTRTRCVGPSGAAPVVVHYPANDWYWGLRPEQAGALVDAVTSAPPDGGSATGGPSDERPSAGVLAGQRVRPS